jgi:hypothetical protein
VDNLNSPGQTSQFERDYVQDLRASLTSLQAREEHFELQWPALELRPALQAYQAQCHNLLMSTYQKMIAAVTVAPSQLLGSINAESSHAVEQFPRISLGFFLTQLSTGCCENLTVA